MVQPRTGTFDAEAMWAKSKGFIDRALKARDHDDVLGFHLWAALALELIGKSALARVNPVLIADPTDFASLLFASGGKEPVDKKNITARTAFDRLTHIIPEFDEQLRRQSTGIAQRRNAELHSGESPMVGLDPRAWVPTFWRCARTIVVGQGRSLDEWVGAAEAARVQAILDDASKLLEQTVRARIERMRKEYAERYPLGSRERSEASARAAARAAPRRVSAQADDVEEHNCPACETKGWLLGYESGEDVDGPHSDGDPREDDFFDYEIVTTYYSVDGFNCVECGLTLDGREELDVADLPEAFVRQDTREPEYEEDYGND